MRLTTPDSVNIINIMTRDRNNRGCNFEFLRLVRLYQKTESIG